MSDHVKGTSISVSSTLPSNPHPYLQYSTEQHNFENKYSYTIHSIVYSIMQYRICTLKYSIVLHSTVHNSVIHTILYSTIQVLNFTWVCCTVLCILFITSTCTSTSTSTSKSTSTSTTTTKTTTTTTSTTTTATTTTTTITYVDLLYLVWYEGILLHLEVQNQSLEHRLNLSKKSTFCIYLNQTIHQTWNFNPDIVSTWCPMWHWY